MAEIATKRKGRGNRCTLQLSSRQTARGPMFCHSKEIRQVKEDQYKAEQLSGVLTTGGQELLRLRPRLTNWQKLKTRKLLAILQSSCKRNGQRITPLKFPVLCQDAHTAARESGLVAERMKQINSNEMRVR